MNAGSLRIIQLIHPEHKRRVALVREPSLILLQNTTSAYDLALAAIDNNIRLKEEINSRLSDEELDYNAVYEGRDPWKILPCFDHPQGPFGCIVSGTGLTHKNSALNRQMMHQSASDKPTDSMQMYQWGVEGGFAEKGMVGVQPEWFYKGNGSVLRAHGELLEVPSYANDGGEEPELAGLYVVDKNGQPWRIGFCIANEFSDHVMEKKNYLYLAPSKLRNCAVGPELVIDSGFNSIEGSVSIERNGSSLWSKNIKTGQANMAHSLSNLEHHHFKYSGHRLPYQAHVHFFGADAFSFGDKVLLEDGDLMVIHWDGFGRSLINPLKISDDKETLIEVKML